MNDQLEERVRRLLRDTDHDEPRAVVPHVLLADVHRGARRRRRRRTAVVAAASVLAVAGVSTALAARQSVRETPGNVAVRPTPRPPASPTGLPTPAGTARPTTGLPRDAALGTIGIDGTPSGQTWRVAAENCRGTVCARIARDDGKGWATLRLIEWADAATGKRSPDAPVEAVEVAPDGQDAWVYGHQLWSTHDGGATWHRQLLDRAAPPERVDVASEDGRAFALQPDPARLWASEASGDTWQELRLPSAYRFGEALTSVAGTVGVVTYSPSTDERVLLVSHDDGATWHESSLPCTGEFGPIRTTAGTMFLHCSDGSGRGMNVWRSSDGDRWRILARVRTSTYVDDVVPVDDDTVLVVTGDGGLLVTARGEQRVDVPLTREETVLSGKFVTPRRGYLVLAPQRLLRTTDGGHSWVRAD